MTLSILLLTSLVLNLISIALIGSLFYLLYTNIFANPYDMESEKELLEETKRKSSNIIHKSIRDANQILTSAELKGLGIFAKQKLDSKKLLDEYKKRLEELERDLETEFAQKITSAEKDYTNMLKLIEANLYNQVKQNQDMLVKKSNESIINYNL